MSKKLEVIDSFSEKELEGDRENMSVQSGQHKTFIKLKSESGTETTCYSSVYEGFPVEFKELAAKKLNESEEQKIRGLQKLKDYLQRNHMTALDDHLLLTILRMSKYNLKKAKERMKKFYCKRREIIEMVADLDGTGQIEKMADDMFYGVLPYRDEQGNAIVFLRECGVNLERYKSHDICVFIEVFNLLLLKYPLASVTKFALLNDQRDFSCRNLIPVLREFKKFLFTMIAFPIRISRVAVLNENFLCRIFFQVASSLVDKKVIGRFSWHGPHIHELQKFYDPKILPEEYGGSMGPLSNMHYKQKLLDFIQELKKENIS